VNPTISISKLADLAGIAHATARKRLTAAGANPESDEKYDLGVAIRALLASADIHEERRRLIVAQREKIEFENDVARGSWVHVDDIFKAYEGVFVAIRQTVLASNLTDSEKAEFMAELRHEIVTATPIGAGEP
jgi:hypothetical protein